MTATLLIAPLASQATAGRVAALGSGSSELHVADISTRPVRYRLDRHPFSLIRSRHDLSVTSTDPMYAPGAGYGARAADILRSVCAWSESERIRTRLGEVITEVRPDVAVLYYGPSATHFGRIVRKLRPDLPLVLIHNVLPISVERQGALAKPVQNLINNELLDYRRWLARFDFFVHASEEMADFAARRFGIGRERMAVIPDYFPRGVQAGPEALGAPRADEEPSVIYLGAPERWGNAIDAVDDEFLEIARAGVSVYSGEMSEEVVRTGRGFKYRYFSDDEVFEGVLATYAHRFHAALVTYAMARRMERFRSTLPTRFFTALAAGMPIAVRGGMFDAVETYVRRHDIGFTYRDARELREKLGEREAMARYRANAIAHLKMTAAEDQAPLFDAIFDRLVAGSGKRPANR